jgi:hypothetical protein
MVPFAWWEALVVIGAALSLVLMVVFLAPTKILPMALGVLLIVAVFRGWSPRPAV